MTGKGLDRRYPETVLEPLGSNSILIQVQSRNSIVQETYRGRSRDKGNIRTKSNKGPKRVHGIYKGKFGTENKGGILQGPDYSKERRDKRVQSRDTGNSIARLRQGMVNG